MAKSLFRACKNTIRNGASGIQDVGGNQINIEYYTQSDIDTNYSQIQNLIASGCTFGDSDESKVVLVASSEITIPENYTLTPANPKKSLVIICNTLTNNGTISMTAKAPYVKPHDWFIVGTGDGYSNNIVIPALANNEVGDDALFNVYEKYPSTPSMGFGGINGNNGINRQCGSGGTGSSMGHYDYSYRPYSGSGYAFGGGAGSGGLMCSNTILKTLVGNINVSKEYPSKGGTGIRDNNYYSGGVGNPTGYKGETGEYKNNTGCGGRIIIFCNKIINNGSITANGVSSETHNDTSHGGASGGGAIDLFYQDASTSVLNLSAIVANGGSGAAYNNSRYEISGNGGKGSVTLSNGTDSPLWTMPDCFKPQRKKFSQSNWTYLFGEYATRLNEEI